ncbi:MAG: DNA-binding protein [Desulfobulbaceae bacterium]|nr:DNA-binding protein [Desulfobulbaceae bacterium]
MARNRPTLFVGSSSEGLKIAKAIQVLLDQSCEVTIWSQGIFGLGEGTLESLVNVLDDFDFAVLVLTPDDLLTSRNESSSAPRDNVLFELGLFMGALGRKRTFIIHDRSEKLKMPSDLAGVTAATYEPHSTGNLQSALGAAATRIEDQILKLGVRDAERLKGLSEAAQGFDEAASQMEKLVELIARSRKVELDIISTQFGPLIAPDKLKQMNRDLVDLEETLSRSKKLAT